MEYLDSIYCEKYLSDFCILKLYFKKCLRNEILRVDVVLLIEIVYWKEITLFIIVNEHFINIKIFGNANELYELIFL